MKPTSALRHFILAAASSLLALSSASAQSTYTWTQAGMAAQSWTDAANWDGNGVFASGSGNALVFHYDFSATPSPVPISLSAGTQTFTAVPAALSMNALTLYGKGPNNTTGTFCIIGDSSSTWTLGDGTTSTITQNSSAGGGTNVTNGITLDRFVDYTIASNLTLNQANTTFTGNGGGARGIVLTGDIGQSATGYGITKSGSHLLIFEGNNTYTGTTTVSAGSLRLGSATALPGGTGVSGGTSALTLNGGVVDLASTDFKRNLGTGSDQFQITGGTSGFSAYGAPRVVTVNNDANQELVWGSAFFNPSALALNTSTAIAPGGLAIFDLTLSNKIDLNGATRTVQVSGNTAILPGVIRDATGGSAGLTKTGNGRLVLSGANTYTGPTTISAGTLSVGATSNLGAASAGLVFNGGTLQVTGTSLTSISGIGHTVTFNASKTAGFDIDNAANTFTVNQVLNQSSGGLTKAGAGTLVLNQANTFTGATTVAGGTLVLDYGSGQDNRKLANPITALTLNGGNLVLRGGSYPEGASATSTAANTGNTISREGVGATSTINLGAISLGTLSTLAIADGGVAGPIAQSSSTTTNGILAAGAITVGSNFAAKSGSNIVAYSIPLANQYTSGAGASTPTVVNEWIGGGTLSSTLSSYALRISNSGNSDVLNIGSANFQVINSGTILYGGGADHKFTINGTGRLTPSNGNQALIVNTNTGTLTVNALLCSTGASTLVKSGAGTLVVGSANTYSGPNYVMQGTLLVNNTTGSGTGTGPVSVQSGATLGGTGTIGGDTTIAHWGKLTFNLSTDPGTHDKLELATGKKLTFAGDSALTITSSGTPTTGLFTLVTAPGGISGSAPATVNLPVGWTAGAPYIDGNDLKINITSTGGGGSAYDTWKTANSVTGTPDQDQDGDGVSNAVEFVLGGTSATNDLDKLPVTDANGTNMTFTFLRKQSSIDPKTALWIEVSPDLVNWTTSPSPYTVADAAAANNPGVTVVKDTPANYDTVTLTVPQDSAKKFARLKVVIMP
jgi:autotransporter-associated beta strand protein